MEGYPAWMASLCLRGPRGIIHTARYTMEQMLQSRQVLYRALEKAGDPSRERLFRANACLYLHRCTSTDEQARLPHCETSFPAALPIQVLYTKGLPPIPSTDPCADPRRHILDPRRPDLWLPEDCGACVSCLARDRVRAGKGRTR